MLSYVTTKRSCDVIFLPFLAFLSAPPPPPRPGPAGPRLATPPPAVTCPGLPASLARSPARLPQVRDHYQATALMLCTERGHTEMVKALLSAGAEIGCVDENGNSALHLACFYGRMDAVELLLAVEADVAVRLPSVGSFMSVVCVTYPRLAVVFSCCRCRCAYDDCIHHIVYTGGPVTTVVLFLSHYCAVLLSKLFLLSACLVMFCIVWLVSYVFFVSVLLLSVYSYCSSEF